ncbi:CD1375 family protein [Brevibacillus gelatini]
MRNIDFLHFLAIFSLGGGEKPVVAIYVALIVAGRRTYDSVPTPLKPAVKEELEALGLSTDGAPLA